MSNVKVIALCDGEIPVFEDSYSFSIKQMIIDRSNMGKNDFLSKDDIKAINMYVDSLSSSHGIPRYDINTILRKWLQLSSVKQAAFYDLVYQENVVEKAREIILCELKEAAKDRVKRTYCLECDYNKLSEVEKEPYYEKAKQVLREEKEADGKREVDEGLKFINSMGIMICVNNYTYYGSVDERSFFLFCRKMRPQLLLEPGMFEKYHFQQFLILEERWRKLSKAEKEVYYKLDARKKLILDEMTKRELNDCDISNRLQEAYDDDKEDEYKEEVKRNRIQLVNDFPDFDDLIYEEANDGSYSLFKDSECEYDYRYNGEGLDRDDGWTIWHMAQSADTTAFEMFKKDVCPHENGYRNIILWDKWFELTESQQEEYYEKSENKRWEDRALVLYEEADNFETHCAFEHESFEKARQFWIEKAKESWPADDDETEPDQPNDPNVWIEDLYSTYCPKFIWCFPIMEDKAIYSHVYYKWLSIRNDPEVKKQRKIRVCRKLEEEFRNNPEIREQRYAEIQRNMEIYEDVEKRILSPGMFYKKEVDELRSKPDDPDFDDAAESSQIWATWRSFSDDEKAVYDEKAKQARMQLMHDFPDFNYYFYWEESWWKDGDRLCDIVGYNTDFDDADNGDDADDDNNVSDDDKNDGDDQNDADNDNMSEEAVLEAPSAMKCNVL